MYEFSIIISIVVGLAFLTIYGNALEMTLSRGTPTFITGAWLLWGLPLMWLVFAALFTQRWRGAAAALAIALGTTIGCYLGSRIARWRRHDSFEGAILGGFTGLFVSGPLAVNFILH